MKDLTDTVQLVDASVAALKDNASRLGLTWQLTFGTVTEAATKAPASVTVLPDGPDAATVPAVNLAGPVAVGGRVALLTIPPAGYYLISSVVGDGPRGIMATPVNTTSNGTSTAANTTEVRDAVLGDYEFIAEQGRLYEVVYNGLRANAAVIPARFVARIRDGGTSTPTTGDTLLAEGQVLVAVALSVGRTDCPFAHTFTTTAGVRTLSAFTQSPDSVILTPTAGAPGRELFVRDIGPA